MRTIHPDLFRPVSPVTTHPTQLSISPKHNQTIVKDPLPSPRSSLISNLVNDKERDLFPYKANQLSCGNPNMSTTSGNDKSSLDARPNSIPILKPPVQTHITSLTSTLRAAPYPARRIPSFQDYARFSIKSTLQLPSQQILPEITPPSPKSRAVQNRQPNKSRVAPNTSGLLPGHAQHEHKKYDPSHDLFISGTPEVPECPISSRFNALKHNLLHLNEITRTLFPYDNLPAPVSVHRIPSNNPADSRPRLLKVSFHLRDTASALHLQTLSFTKITPLLPDISSPTVNK
ncbi:hypothetical protein ACOME3_003214 [Neoechinorhynchus agilis]